jgi:CBS domain-containing protein
MRRKVGDVMTNDVVTVRDTTPFKEIVGLLEEHHVSAVPVVDRRKRLVGIVTEADLLVKERHGRPEPPPFLEGHRSRAERAKARARVASELMTAPVITVTPFETIAEAARLMHRHNVKRLPVVDADGDLLGIVGRADLLKVFLRSDGEIRQEVEENIIQRLLKWDPASVRVTVRDGVVSMSGRLPRKTQVEILVGLVYGIEGVVGVDNRLTFEFDDEVRGVLPWPVG